MKNDSGVKSNPFTAFILHLHPRTVPLETIRFTLSFGLGGMAATLFAVMVGTGLLQLIQYSPSPESAYHSIIRMYAPQVFGGYIRNIHFWAGNLLVIVSALHLLRVFFTGALSGKRRINWLVGVSLFLLVLFANFTGYLLPWDQLAYWAITIFTNMMSYIPMMGDWLVFTLRGGREVGPVTLGNFFALHIGVLPSLMVLLLLCHFWLIRKAGGLVLAENRTTARVAVKPHLIRRELATALVLLAMVCVFSALIDAPLSEPANPGESPNPAKAAWYFMGLQELLLHLHPSLALFIVPSFMLAGLLAVPFFPGTTLPEGVWFGGSRGAKLAGLTFIISTILTIAAVWLDDTFLRSGSLAGSGNVVFIRGVMPIFLVLLLQGGLYFGLRWLGKFSRAECTMAVVTTYLAMISGLTLIGIWFRGAGMKLVWP